MTRYIINGINPKQWDKFKALCALEGLSAAEKFRRFIDRESDRFDSIYKKTKAAKGD